MTNSQMVDRLTGVLTSFKNTSILVIGDIMIDQFIWGKVSRISPEAPVPVVDVTNETFLLGGAANVLNNIFALGGQAVICGVIGRDAMGDKICDMLQERGLSQHALVRLDDRPTAVKTRVVAHNQQVVRVDREKKGPVTGKALKELLRCIENTLPQIKGIIVSDYGKGVITRDFMDGLRAITKDTAPIISVDPKVGHFRRYRETTIITPNHLEASQATGIDITDMETLIKAGKKLLHDINCQSVIITRGEAGMSLFEGDGRVTHIPTVARQVFDVTGAGDTVIAALTLGMLAGLDLKDAAMLANFAAGVVVGEVGTSVVTPEKLRKAITSFDHMEQLTAL
ncbi:MAG: D-glycero-beta-D-manno-heptose-7-phosphate kinase [Deltaproteobacteria bacterium]|nr:D-glycero-beta-D-manno-heptose-7-phosphate kinase [Deltaproteobacteria bacterium]